MSLARPVAVAALIVCASRSLAGGAQVYDFTINTAASGLTAMPSFTVVTAGTLIGNWDPKTNPTGTRTKPGINPFAPFGPAENLPVMLDLGAELGGSIDSAPSGGFGMTIAPGLGGVSISGFSANLLSGGPVVLPLTLGFEFEGFRTRNPTSTYIGGFPLELPLGSASVTSLAVEQVGGGAPGLLTASGPGQYDFVVAPIVTLAATVSFLGQEFTIPGTPVPFPIAGQLTLAGDTAMLLSVQPIEFAQVLNPGLALPEIPFELPTVLPPGGVANVLMNLTLSEIGAAMSGTQTLSATGVLVPGPGPGVAALVLGFGATARRRRR